MNFLIVVAFVATLAAANAASLTAEQNAEKQELIDHCKGEIRISDEDIAKLKTAESTDISQDVKCFANCVLEKVGAIKDGAPQKSAIVEKYKPIIGEEKANSIAELCSTVKGTDNCDTAYKLRMCFAKNDGIIE